MLEAVNDKIEVLKEMIGSGGTVTGTMEETAIQTAKNVGRIEGLKELTLIHWEN